jgi:hypothetical protein
MKTTPLLYTSPDSRRQEITRQKACECLRFERAKGKVHKLPSGYLLFSQEIFIKVPRAPRPKRIDNPDPFALSMRLTYGYNSGWSHLDKWHDMGNAKVTHAAKTREDDYSFSQLLILEVDAPGYRPRNVMRAIHETMVSGCRCEHDCCGHIQSSPSKVRPLRNGTYAVLLTGYRNV